MTAKINRTEWKPRPGEVIYYQWGGFPNDSCPVIVVSVDPWECAEIWETPGTGSKYVPDSPNCKIEPIGKLLGDQQRKAAVALAKHGFHAEAVEILLEYVKELEYEVKQTLEGAQQSNRAQVQFINLGQQEIDMLKKQNAELLKKIGG